MNKLRLDTQDLSLLPTQANWIYLWRIIWCKFSILCLFSYNCLDVSQYQLMFLLGYLCISLFLQGIFANWFRDNMSSILSYVYMSLWCETLALCLCHSWECARSYSVSYSFVYVFSDELVRYFLYRCLHFCSPVFVYSNLLFLLIICLRKCVEFWPKQE